MASRDQLMFRHHLLLYLVMALSIANLETHAESKTSEHTTASMVVRYYNRGDADAHHAYKFELIEKALEITRPEYGDYLIDPYRLQPSSKRQPVMVSEGKLLNLIWASPGTHHTQGDVVAIPIDISKGALGYRVCLITSNTPPFDNIKQLEDLRGIRIGQIKDWADTRIYQHNGIQPVSASNYEGLFEMLSFDRFDCLALGANEVMLAYRAKKTTYTSLKVDSQLLIVYKYPLYFYVSKKFTDLAERIETGLKKLQKNGEFDQLFNKHFGNDIKALALDQRKIICLQSPYTDPKEQSCPSKEDLKFSSKK